MVLAPFNLFISYSSKDKNLVDELAPLLQRNGVNVIYDENALEYGQNWRAVLTDSLREADGVLVLITSHSIESQYVMNEIGMTRAFENKLLLPLIHGDVTIPLGISDLYAIVWRDDIAFVVDSILKTIDNFNTTRFSNNNNDDYNKTPQTQSLENNVNEGRTYWMLKMNPNTWEIDLFQEGGETYFNTYFFGNERPEHQLFSKVAKNDFVLGYATGDIQSVVCIMEVLNQASSNVRNGEGFAMRIWKVLDPRIPLQNFTNTFNEIPFISEIHQKPLRLLFELQEDQYRKILASAPQTENQFIQTYRPFYLTEGSHSTTDDQLEFEEDINAFAAVIALSSVKPPLAIGLFGNWGSGKSFFMDKLENKINLIAENEEPDYVKNVVQVRFNSWHYSDTSLWASLTTQIFESLHDYATKKQYGDKAIQAIYEDLSITSYQIEETKKKLESNQNEVLLLEEQKTIIEKNIDTKKERLEMWSAGELMRVVFSDPYILNDFNDIKSRFNAEKLIENIEDIDAKYSEIESVGGQVIESINLLKENRKGAWKWVWVLAVVFVLLGWLFLGPLKETIEEFIEGGTLVTGLALTWMVNFIHKLTPFFNKIRTFHKRLKSLKQTVEKEKGKVKLKEEDEINKLQNDLKNLQAEKQILEESQKQTEDKKQKLELQLREVGSGKLLTTFLQGRTADDAYIKQLGIISLIRKDFAKLNELFKRQTSVQTEEKDLKTEVQIDRIVLYIDDLDRCNEDIVVKVLEAIHLLLAFELFVVVVGVDPRWLNNALSEKYKSLFGQKTHTREVGDDDKSDAILKGAATSYDYLEKIFQIPFALKSINKSGREKLIGYLVKNEMMEDDATKGIERLSQPTETIAINVSSEINPNLTFENEVQTPIVGVSESNVTKKRLVFSKSETVYMQQISSFFGKTPRAINRYVNIYRIIKAHGSLKASAEFSKSDFMPIMFLLGVIVGHSLKAKKLIAEIMNANDTDLFSDFIKKAEFDNDFRNMLISNSKEIENLEMKNFIKNVELISRFSFRTLLEND